MRWELFFQRARVKQIGEHILSIMASRILQWTQAPPLRGKSLGIPLAAAAVASWCIVQSVVPTTDLDNNQDVSEAEERPFSYQIPVNFIDKLASKPYLHFSQHESAQQSRPVGVPETLRILTVDLPEIRRGFHHGHCSVDARKIYPDGIASPETIETKKGGRGKVRHVEVEQKAWVKSMVQCIADGSQKVSVEILEADVGRMNPSNIRRIHQYGTLRYDPGKYAVTSPRKDRTRKNKSKRDVESLRDDEETKLINEMQAPWHQQAWREEAMLRISGQVRFGETMQEADVWTKRLFGYQYQSTVTSSSRSWLDTIFFWRSHKPDEGIDGSPVPNAASNRPHAVIANGLALQMVPNSLRVLQKLCAAHNVPLFVIRDPRSWGGNTHPDDLGQVLRDLQKTVKQQIVTSSLQHAAGTAFRRGRTVGQLETEAKWQAKDALRKSKEISTRAMNAFREHRETDWSKLSEQDLEKRLAFHGLVKTLDDATSGDATRKEISEALAKIAERYNVETSSTTKESTTTTDSPISEPSTQTASA